MRLSVVNLCGGVLMICHLVAGQAGLFVPSRPGTCPLGGTPSNGDRQCYSDNDCASDRKCCPIGTSGSSYCARPRLTLTVTPYAGNNKAGTCPVAPTNTAGTSAACWNQCSSDSGCSGDLKCCRTSACSTGCRAPVSNPLPTGVKAGTCNVQQSYEGGCTSSCSADSHCSGTMKCCRNACAFVCAQPLLPFANTAPFSYYADSSL